MQAKPVIPRLAADRDVDSVFEHYWEAGGPDLAARFIGELRVAYAHLSRHGATGSPRYAHKLGIGGLRAWQLARFPYLVFYFDKPDAIDVIRVLHGAMDLPEWLEQ